MKTTAPTFFILMLLVSCSPRPVQTTSQHGSVMIVNHAEPNLQVDFLPFKNLGCTSSGYGWFECGENSLAFKLGCTSIAENKLLGGFTPNYPLAECGYFFPEKEPLESVDVPPTECFSITVMINGTSCSRLILFKDDNYVLIKNLDELGTFFAPIDSPGEALGFALATDDYSAKYGQTQTDNYVYYVQKLEDTYIETVVDGYLVHVFYARAIGCGPFETQAVEVKVTRDGDVEEVNRHPVYRDPSQDGICVD